MSLDRFWVLVLGWPWQCDIDPMQYHNNMVCHPLTHWKYLFFQTKNLTYSFFFQFSPFAVGKGMADPIAVTQPQYLAFVM